MSIIVAAVGYTNAWPLLTRLDRMRFQVHERHPAQVAEMLARGQADVGLVPVAAMLSDGEYKVVPGWCIGAEGPVHSVLLVAETPPELWTEVALDGVSRTSVVLARLLLGQGPLSERVRPDLRVNDCPPTQGLELARGTVAGLVIGDAARNLPARCTTVLDLGALWWEWTGLPFVFAVWAGRPELPHHAVQGLKLAASEGIELISGLPEPDRSYLRDSIRYTLDDRALMGLRRFAALGREAGLLGHPSAKGRVADFELYGPPQGMRERPNMDSLLARCASPESMGATALEAMTLCEQAPLGELALCASLRAAGLFGTESVTYCQAGEVDVTQEPARVLARLHALQDAGVAAVDLQGELPLNQWRALLPFLATHSELALRALTPMGVARLLAELEAESADSSAAASRATDADLLSMLKELRSLGLSALQPGPGLLLNDSVRAALAPTMGPSLPAALEARILAAASTAGLLPTAALSAGHLDTLEQRVLALLAMAELAPLSLRLSMLPIAAVGWQHNTAADLQRLVALARLMLPTSHIFVDLRGHALGTAQVMLHSGADDLGEVDASDGPTLDAVELHLREAGRQPARRGLHFEPLGGALTRPAWSADRARPPASR